MVHMYDTGLYENNRLLYRVIRDVFIDKVREYTDGAIEITLYSHGLMGTHDESFHGVRDGTIEI